MIQVILDEIEKPANANTKAEAINTDTAGSSGNLQPSSTSPASAAQPTYSEDDDIEAVLFLLFMFFLIIIAVVGVAIRHQRRLQRKEEKRKTSASKPEDHPRADPVPLHRGQEARGAHHGPAVPSRLCRARLPRQASQPRPL